MRWYVNVDSTGVIIHDSNCPPRVLAHRFNRKTQGGWSGFDTEQEAWEYAKSRSGKPRKCRCR